MDAAPANDAQLPLDAPAEPDVLTIEELASMLRVRRKSLYEMVARGAIPGVQKIGRVWRAHRPTVVAWLAGQISASPEPRKRGRR